MSWLRLLLGALDLLVKLAKFLGDRQLIEAGAAAAVAAGLETAQRDISQALAAREEARRRWADPAGRFDDDGFRRD